MPCQLLLFEEERRLTEQIERIELLGELALTKEYVEGLGACIGDLVSRCGRAKATRVLEQRYPSILAVFLAGIGIFGYERGDYYTAVTRVIGCSADQNWGKLFLTFLKKQRKPILQIKDAHPYVTPILLHAGIPVYCLPDFFKYLLMPALNRPELTDGSAADLITDWLSAPPGRFPVDKPVLRFLEHGGALAVDLVERCLDLGRRWAQSGVVPAPAEVGLPEHVVVAFADWVQTTGDHVRSAGIQGLRRPTITLDPWGEGLTVTLPAQELPDGDGEPRPVWRVDAGGAMSRRPVRALRRGNGWCSEPDQIILTGPAVEYVVTFEDGRDQARTWRFAGLSPRTPLLAFDAASGRLLAWRGALPGRLVWLLYPDEPGRHLEGPAGCRLEWGPGLPWQWARYRLERWDLRHADRISLGGERIAVQQDAAGLRPYLAGQPVAGVRGPNGAPIYAGAPPEVKLPLASADDPAARLDRWTITLLDGVGRPFRSLSLADLAAAVDRGPEALTLSLAAPAMLGPMACGTFTVHLRGPLGRDMSLPLAVVPALRLSGAGRVRLPDENGALPRACFRLETAADIAVDGEPGATLVPSGSGAFSVTVPAGLAEVSLTLTPPYGRGAPVPITVPLPSLRWTLVEGHAAVGVDAWTTRPLNRPIAWLEQAEVPYLVVAVTGAMGERPLSAGRLLVQAGPGHILQEVPFEQPASRWLSLSLATVRDTVRASGLPSLELLVEFDALPGNMTAAVIPVLRLTQELALRDLTLMAEREGDSWRMWLHWAAAPPLRHRQLVLWPRWRPWEAPVTVPIPDTAGCGTELRLPVTELPPGVYRAEIIIRDPWADTSLRRPPVGAPNTVELVLGSLDERAAYLRARPEDVLGLLERALAAEDRCAADEALIALREQFERAHVDPALAALLAMASVDDAAMALVDDDWPGWPVLGKLLVAFPANLLRAVTRRVPDLDANKHQTFQRLLLALGTLDAPLTGALPAGSLQPRDLIVLWQFWPALAAATEAPALLADDAAAWERARAILGVGSAGELAKRLVDDALFGRAPEVAAIEATGEQLCHIQRYLESLQLLPRGLCDPDAWVTVNLAWLIALKHGPRERWDAAVAWQERRCRVLVDMVEKLAALSSPLERLARLMLGRHDRRWHDQPGNLPFMAGAVALALRGLVHLDGAATALRLDRSALRADALQAFAYARDLFTRDLCLIELVLAPCMARSEEADQ